MLLSTTFESILNPDPIPYVLVVTHGEKQIFVIYMCFVFSSFQRPLCAHILDIIFKCSGGKNLFWSNSEKEIYVNGWLVSGSAKMMRIRPDPDTQHCYYV